MAESVVGFLVQTLASSAVDEVKLLKGVRVEISQIKDEFRSMQAVLRDADAKEDSNESVKEWVTQVRRLAYETEDVLDDYRLLQHNQGRICDLLKNMKTKHQLANRIKEIKSEASGIASRKDKYGLSHWEEGSTSQAPDVQKGLDPRNQALYVKEAQLVGIDKTREKYVQWSVNDEKQTSVLSIYGEGGLGKTTLIKKVFDNQDVKARFKYRAWATVSERYDARNLLRDLIGQIPPREDENNRTQDQINDMDANKLIDMLRGRLHGNRYLLVFDDIWNSDAWRLLKNVLPDEMEHGSRIIVTTRFQHVAKECKLEIGHGEVFELPHLLDEDALKLFGKVAISSNDLNNFPNHLIDISKKFLRKCKGLPLAITSIAGLLRTKPTVEWDQVYDSLGFLMASNENLKDLKSIISLSYKDLPFHLKSCFLYLCIFPEDFSINCGQLVRLWVAEGFVERKPGMSSNLSMDSIGRGYLDELINRCLVQVEVLDNMTGRVKRCRVHDVMRDFIIEKAHEQALVAHLDNNGLHGLVIDNNGLHGQVFGRRLSILSDFTNMFILVKENKKLFSHLRSLILFDEVSDFYKLSDVIKRFKLLRVLSIKCDISWGGAGFDWGPLFNWGARFPRKLYHLRYLCIPGSCFMLPDFPSFIGTLTDLEFLELEGDAFVVKLPKEILKLKRLRYLCNRSGVFEQSWMELPNGIETLTNLEYLSVVNAGIKESSKMLKSLGMLTRMKKLKIANLKREDGKHLCASIEKMKQLRSLHIETLPRTVMDGCVDLDNLTSAPQYLEKLELDGRLLDGKTPLWFPKLQNIIKLSLENTDIRDGRLIKSLQELPSLAKLELNSSSLVQEEELYFEKGGFPRLKALVLCDIEGLRKMTVEEGAMPSIEVLHISSCYQLKEAPLGIEYLTTLKAIKIGGGMADSFKDEIKKRVGKAGPTIEECVSFVEYIDSVESIVRGRLKRKLIHTL